MKKILILVFLISIFFKSQGQFSLGLAGGGNIFLKERIHYLNVDDRMTKGDYINKMSYGFHVGIPLEFGLSKRISIYSEVNYYRNKNNKRIFETKNSLNYIHDIKSIEDHVEIPLLLKYYFVNKKFKSYILLGTNVNYQVQSSRDGYERTFEYNEDGNYYNNFYYYSKERGASLDYFDVSLSAGLGFSYRIYKGNVFMQSRFNKGLLNKGFDKVDIYNQGVTITAGYLFSISKIRDKSLIAIPH